MVRNGLFRENWSEEFNFIWMNISGNVSDGCEKIFLIKFTQSLKAFVSIKRFCKIIKHVCEESKVDYI